MSAELPNNHCRAFRGLVSVGGGPGRLAAAELHTASIAAKDEEDELKAKKIAVGGTMAIAAVGLALLLGGKKR